MKNKTIKKHFTGCKEGETQAYLINSNYDMLAKTLVKTGFLRLVGRDGKYHVYALTLTGELKTTIRTRKIG